MQLEHLNELVSPLYQANQSSRTLRRPLRMLSTFPNPITYSMVVSDTCASFAWRMQSFRLSFPSLPHEIVHTGALLGAITGNPCNLPRCC